MTPRKRLEGPLAEWYPHPKEAPNSLVPVVRESGGRDDIADRFFDSTPQGYAPEPPPVLEASEDTSQSRSAESAAIRERRRYLMRYVFGAVGVASVIGLGALGRFTIMRASAAQNDGPSRPSVTSFAAEPPSAPFANEAPATPTPPVANDRPTDEPSTADPPDETVVADATKDIDTSAALDAKRASQRALNRGRVVESIEDGELSVSLDPTDAEAWLILGAAYQMRGSYASARRCFASCGRLAKRGARGECRALLR